MPMLAMMSYFCYGTKNGTPTTVLMRFEVSLTFRLRHLLQQ
jgi:hypothetical protein